MQFELVRHPNTPARLVEMVAVDIQPSGGCLSLWYMVFGGRGDILIPHRADERRADGLWNTTCFELFIRDLGAASYREYNFSPSTEWAAYAFTGYRADMVELELPHPPIISHDMPSNWLEVHVSVPMHTQEATGRIGLSAVIEEKSGHKSYWALAHPPSGPPDFHHPDCFVLELPPAPAS